MKPLQKTVRSSMAASLALAAICLASSTNARAEAFAQAILTINNFRLLQSNGTAFDATDFKTLEIENFATAEARHGNNTATAPTGFETPDIAHQFVGTPSPPLAENDFDTLLNPTPVPGNFGYADQYMSGSAVTKDGNPAGLKVQSRADAALTQDGLANGSSNISTITNFVFMLSAAGTMTFDFEATPFARARTDGDESRAAIARLEWFLEIEDMNSGAKVFRLAPDQLNVAINRTDRFPGTSTHAPGTLLFRSTSPLLAANTEYLMSISHDTTAYARQTSVVPEPASLAIFGLGLLGMSSFLRRRR